MGAGVRAYPFARFFHRKETNGSYVASFFVGLRFAYSLRRKIDLGPLVADYLQIINAWEGRGPGMDLTIHLVLKKNLPSFVFATIKAAGGSGSKIAPDALSRPNNQCVDLENVANVSDT